MKTKRNETPAKTADRRQKVHSELSLDFQSGVLLDLGAPRQGSFGQLRFTHSDSIGVCGQRNGRALQT